MRRAVIVLAGVLGVAFVLAVLVGMPLIFRAAIRADREVRANAQQPPQPQPTADYDYTYRWARDQIDAIYDYAEEAVRKLREL